MNGSAPVLQFVGTEDPAKSYSVIPVYDTLVSDRLVTKGHRDSTTLVGTRRTIHYSRTEGNPC